ncbi:FecCD family ABC transporter permease [Metamycoplasma salivarium]|uniref:FecCD family ABC transporter permease n=1 Tax=Metamycoplasma salivarium TaxID=2124 RepID=UPI0027E51ACD|nr:iron ABC transporter permease [Metamycoplasma salivarium]
MYAFIFAISIVVTILIFLLSLIIGRYVISLKTFFAVLSGNNTSLDYQNAYSVIVYIRLPRSLIAMLVGVSLSLAGLIYQQLFKNKLASPNVLGISSGASAGAAICIYLGMSGIFGGIVITLVSFTFGMATVLLVVAMSKVFRTKSSVSLILAGIIVSGLMSSILSIIKTISNPDSTLPQIVYWLMGSFSKANMNQFWILLPIVVICTIILIIIRWRINLVALGRIVSMSKGLNYTFYKWLLIFIGAMLISASVAVSGNVSWVGLIIPNILTMIFKNDNRKTIIFSIPIGASFMILVDILSRSITPDEIPLSGITGVIGLITIIIFFILKFRKGHKNA